jgi:hypothetical protein
MDRVCRRKEMQTVLTVAEKACRTRAQVMQSSVVIKTVQSSFRYWCSPAASLHRRECQSCMVKRRWLTICSLKPPRVATALMIRVWLPADTQIVYDVLPLCLVAFVVTTALTARRDASCLPLRISRSDLPSFPISRNNSVLACRINHLARTWSLKAVSRRSRGKCADRSSL